MPRYPLHYKGDPQRRLYLPKFWMKMMKPKEKVPKDHVQFLVHPEMSCYDVKQYLEKIYSVPVLNVRMSVIKHRELPKVAYMNDEESKKKRKELRFDHQNWTEFEEKIAYVQLLEDTFEFPSLVKEGDVHEFEKDARKAFEMKKEEEKMEDKAPKHGVPEWLH